MLIQERLVAIVLQTAIEEMQGVVEGEIAASRERYPNSIVPGFEEFDSYEGLYLNNFNLKALRVGGCRGYDVVIAEGYGDRPFSDLRAIGWVTPEGNSELFYSRTPNQFISDIDMVIGLCGVDVTLLQQKFEQSRAEESPYPLKEFAEKMMPVYMVLLAIGYNHKDLVA